MTIASIPAPEGTSVAAGDSLRNGLSLNLLVPTIADEYVMISCDSNEKNWEKIG